MAGAARSQLERSRAGGVPVVAGRVHRPSRRLDPPGNRLAARRAPQGPGRGLAAGPGTAARRVAGTARRRRRARVADTHAESARCRVSHETRVASASPAALVCGSGRGAACRRRARWLVAVRRHRARRLRHRIGRNARGCTCRRLRPAAQQRQSRGRRLFPSPAPTAADAGRSLLQGRAAAAPTLHRRCRQPSRNSGGHPLLRAPRRGRPARCRHRGPRASGR